jgi:predicted ribosomally synthesized peptide with SipW-like signal peptide
VKKLLIVAMSCLLCLGLVGGAFAYFTDTETSTGNTFTAGTLDLKMSNSEDSGPWYDTPTLTVGTASGMCPGVEVGPYYIGFKNVGTCNGYVRVTIDYLESDDDPESGEFAGDDVTANQYAKKTLVTQAYMDDDAENKVPYWVTQIVALYTDAPDAESHGAIATYAGVTGGYVPTIFGLSQVTLLFYDGSEVVFAPNDHHHETVYLELDASAGNSYAWDGIEIQVTGTLTQTNAP